MTAVVVVSLYDCQFTLLLAFNLGAWRDRARPTRIVHVQVIVEMQQKSRYGQRDG